MDLELGDRPDVKPLVLMGNNAKKSGRQVKIEIKKPSEVEQKSESLDESPPKKKKKTEPGKMEVITDMKKSLDGFIEHIKENEKQKNALFREFLDIMKAKQ